MPELGPGPRVTPPDIPLPTQTNPGRWAGALFSEKSDRSRSLFSFYLPLPAQPK
jgi:hypothetical protein